MVTYQKSHPFVVPLPICAAVQSMVDR